MRARATTVRGSALATLIVVASWLVVPAWLPRSGAIPVAEAAGCRTGSHQLSAGDPAASPSSGTTLTTITFSVVVTDTGGCFPSMVELRIPGLAPQAMSPAAGSIRTGLTFQVALQLPVGTWSWGFHVENGSKAGFQTVDVAGAGTIAITSPATPTPKPTSTPTPKPTPSPTPKPTATPVPTPPPTAGPTPTSKGASTPSPRSTRSPSGSHGPSPTPRPSGAGSSSGSGTGGSGGGSSDPGAAAPLGLGPFGPPDADHGPLSDDASGGGPSDAPGAPDAAITGAPTPALGLPFDLRTGLPVVLWAATSAIGVVLFAVLLNRSTLLQGNGSLAIFAMDRRRRRAAERAVVAARTPATPEASEAVATTVVVAGADASDAAPWLARADHVPLRFTAPAGRGVERRTVGYRQVRVSAGPDDIRTPEVGRVDRGDEIEVIGEDPSYFQIRTPDGVEGWVPRFVILGGA